MLRPLRPIVAVPADHTPMSCTQPTALDAALDAALVLFRTLYGAPPFAALPALAIALPLPASAYRDPGAAVPLLMAEIAAFWPQSSALFLVAIPQGEPGARRPRLSRTPPSLLLCPSRLTAAAIAHALRAAA